MVLVVQGELHRARRNKREELQRVVRRKRKSASGRSRMLREVTVL